MTDAVPAPSSSIPSTPPRVLIDTSVLAPEPLWLWILTLTEGIQEPHRPQLFVSPGIARELRPALRRVDPRLTRAQVDTAARLRIDSLTWVHRTPPPDQPRPHVLDPDDVHLDTAALAVSADVLVTDDIHAFAPISAAERGYALCTADDYLCDLADSFTGGLSRTGAGTHNAPGTDPNTFTTPLAEALARYRDRAAGVSRALEVAAPPGSPSHRLRRSLARRFAKRIVRAQRADTRAYTQGA